MRCGDGGGGGVKGFQKVVVLTDDASLGLDNLVLPVVVVVPSVVSWLLLVTFPNLMFLLCNKLGESFKAVRATI